MPELDEDTLRVLLQRSTDDLFAPPAAVAVAIKRQRRRQLRVRAVGAVGTAAAAGLAVGIVASGSGSGSGPAIIDHPVSVGGSATPIRLTAAQQALYSLSSAAAKTPRPVGRYVVLKEVATTLEGGGDNETGGKTSVIDTVTGGGVTYQDIAVSGAGVEPVPSVLNAAPGTSPTLAQLDALPTDPTALRAALLSQAEQQNRQAEQALKDAKKTAVAVPAPGVTADDMVFDQAANLLWEPDLSPQLRSGLYKVLAATPGVLVKTGTKDSSGRPATEISRFDSSADQNVETFENPATGATLESAWAVRTGAFYEDLYQSISYTNTIPADPYGG
jgi:hypothetical protein